MAMYQQQLPEVFKPGNGKVTGHHSLPNNEKHVKHSGENHTNICAGKYNGASYIGNTLILLCDT